MKKSELTKLIESLGDDAEVDETISKSDLGKALASSGLTLDAFKSKMESDPTFKSFLDSEKDKHLQKGIDTFKTNNLQKLVDEEYKKQHPETDPKDTEMAELKRKIEQMEKEKLKEKLTNQALKFATEKKLPVELIDFIVGSDEATTTANLEKLANIFSAHDSTLKAEILKDNTYIPPKGGNPSTSNPWGKEHFNLTEQGRILRENPELAKKYIAESKQ
ncbi:DUF4355 domain-containing protein [Clostridium tyrobutyricum]|uniref:DUF4355 domain-containing protein n=1 Tax=Clostridium tyrobutyricum TaxID=1519 RepID=UPI001C3831D1|nr:DUF4355 domain-containing protein [Clostridium tyrobutyricum]MBV4427149.1 DUF4355 domain-containing protein [Clostridium tyrobutyricum]MBV4442124.1 DUF4355 domain-containing protein [Clostridium tyrobutyricum]MBV4442305.1 DUF4355 domain-containing protein [Clostridium tyrobutyricum]MBV4450159.1 DUF4355 domain-containing protein [Clostridium tyrobutyricum]